MSTTRAAVSERVTPYLTSLIAPASERRESTWLPFLEDAQLAALDPLDLGDGASLAITSADGPATRLDELAWGVTDHSAWGWSLAGEVRIDSLTSPIELRCEGSARLMESCAYITAPYETDPLALALSASAQFAAERTQHAMLGITSPYDEIHELVLGISAANERLTRALTSAMLEVFPSALNDPERLGGLESAR